MPSERPPSPSRPGRSEPWRTERMVQRVPRHFGETVGESFSPWLMLAGVVLLIVIVCAVLFIVMGGFGIGSFVATATPTRTSRSVTPIVTIIPATLPPPTALPTPTLQTTKYKVKPGDSLIAIAAKYKVSVDAIRIVNNLKDDTIRVGDDLLIPLPTPTPRPGASPQSLPASTPTPLSYQSPPTSAPAGTPGVIRYVVRSGDNLIGIAATNGSTVDAIRLANNLESDFLSVGQVLQLPLGAWTPTPTEVPIAAVVAPPTAQFAYAAPNLMFPPDNATFKGKQNPPTLEWVSPGTLKPNEFYVIHLESTVENEKKVLPPLTVRQGTSVKLDPLVYYPGANANGTTFSWYVVVVSQTASRTPSQSAQTFAQSQTSATRTFVWY
jgi:LysM repeat protein